LVGFEGELFSLTLPEKKKRKKEKGKKELKIKEGKKMQKHKTKR